jgi:hypothetical protein
LAREVAHEMALARYGVTQFDLYTRDVVEALPAYFNDLWRTMKGIIQ